MLHIHLAFCRDNGLDVVSLGQGTHVHIIVHHQQFVFQIGTAEPVVFYLLNAGVVHAVNQNGAHHQPDTAFSLTALADEQ